jgi:hypothetical protein|tara:strand:+ start:294 stop:458 length:165 start_codon:yes stop_codon:yes gene_type:complete
MTDLYNDYLFAKEEAKACGQEFVSYEEWLGEESPKEKAQYKQQLIYDNDEYDLY